MEFAQLTNQSKKDNVLALLQTIKDVHQTFAQLYIFVNTVPTISDEVLTYIHDTVLEIGAALEKHDTDLAQTKFTEIQKKLAAIQAAEQADTQKDVSADILLDTI